MLMILSCVPPDLSEVSLSTVSLTAEAAYYEQLKQAEQQQLGTLGQPTATPTEPRSPKASAAPSLPLVAASAGLIYRTSGEVWREEGGKYTRFPEEEGLWQMNSNRQAVRLSERPDALLSPSGAQVLYLAEEDLWLTDLGTGEQQNLSQTPDRIECCPAWWPARPNIILFGSRSPDSALDYPVLGFLSAVDLVGHRYLILEEEYPFSLPPEPNPEDEIIVYANGGRLYYWEKGSEPLEPALYGLSGMRIESLSWSPDGSLLAGRAVGTLEGQWQAAIILVDVTTETAQLLTTYEPAAIGGPLPPPAWSPDGQWLALTSYAADPAQKGVWIVRIDGAVKLQVAPESYDPVWSPDSQWVAFNHFDPKENWQVLLMNVEENRLWRIDLPPDVQVVDWRGNSLQ